MSKRYERSIKDDHLPFPREFMNFIGRQHDLNAIFARKSRRSAVDLLRRLNDEFGIGGLPPRVSVRERKDASAMFVVRDTGTASERSTGVATLGRTVEEAMELPPVRDIFETVAEEKLFALQARHAPATLRYSTIIRRYLVDAYPGSGFRTDAQTKAINKERNVADPDKDFKRDASIAEKLIAELLHDRTLDSHSRKLPSEIKSWLVCKARASGARQDVGGQYKGAANGTVLAYVSLVNRALKWLADTHRPPVRLEMEVLRLPKRSMDPLMWADARLVVLWSRGYVWENGGFAREWVWREGDWHLAWKRRDAKFRAKYKPLLRHVLCYTTVGARLSIAKNMGWAPHGYRGWIDFNAGEFVRAGPNAPQPPNKPRGKTVMLPFVKRMFANWLVSDRRMASAAKCISADLGGHVIHNGRGGVVNNLGGLMEHACQELGLASSSHRMKAANVTQFYLAGFDIHRIALLIGNEPHSTATYYWWPLKRYQGVQRPRPDGSTMTFMDLVNPLGELTPIPRAPVPTRPSHPSRIG